MAFVRAEAEAQLARDKAEFEATQAEQRFAFEQQMAVRQFEQDARLAQQRADNDAQRGVYDAAIKLATEAAALIEPFADRLPAGGEGDEHGR